MNYFIKTIKITAAFIRQNLKRLYIFNWYKSAPKIILPTKREINAAKLRELRELEIENTYKDILKMNNGSICNKEYIKKYIC